MQNVTTTTHGRRDRGRGLVRKSQTWRISLCTGWRIFKTPYNGSLNQFNPPWTKGGWRRCKMTWPRFGFFERVGASSDVSWERQRAAIRDKNSPFVVSYPTNSMPKWKPDATMAVRCVGRTPGARFLGKQSTPFSSPRSSSPAPQGGATGVSQLKLLRFSFVFLPGTILAENNNFVVYIACFQRTFHQGKPPATVGRKATGL